LITGYEVGHDAGTVACVFARWYGDRLWNEAVGGADENGGKEPGVVQVLTSREVGMDLIKEVGMFIAVGLTLCGVAIALGLLVDYWS